MATDKVSRIDLGIIREENGQTKRAELFLETGKYASGRGLRAVAKVYWIGLHMREHCFAIGMGGGDFRKTVADVGGKVATQKAIDALHFATFTPEKVESLTQDAKNYYAAN